MPNSACNYRAVTGFPNCSNVTKFNNEKSIQLKKVFNKNATTNEQMKFKFSKIFSL